MGCSPWGHERVEHNLVTKQQQQAKYKFSEHIHDRLGKNPEAGRDWGQEEKGTTEDEMAGWHH